MADKNEYLGEAYNTLLELSADEKKRLEYEAREKALRDYNFGMNCAREEGEKSGIEKSERKLILKLTAKGLCLSEIAELLDVTEDRVREVQAEAANEQH